MSSKVYLAIDLGAESGRLMAGIFDGARLRVEEIHRFPNTPVKVAGGLHWDVLHIFSEIKRGLTMAAKSHGPALVSLGVDTWGVDYALIDGRGRLLGNPFHYRDERTRGMMERAFGLLPKRDIYRHTGIQLMFINTVFQLLSDALGQTPALSRAARLLMMPDLFNYWLSGAQVNERTIASTSQLYDPTLRNWSSAIIQAMGIPPVLFGEIVSPGAVLGRLLPEIAQETCAGSLLVVAPGCHDTASAIAAVPAQGDRHAYLSSGTWSLMGVETREPVITDQSFEYGFTNEIGVFDMVRLLKNISGLWLVQECRRTWGACGEEFGYEALTELAREATPFAAFIDPDFDEFALPGDMPARIAEYCRGTAQAAAQNPGSIVRTILESLALKYRFVLERAEQLAGRTAEVLHIVGGGTRNELLNQFAANALNRPVITGPVEATSAGNILMQMVGTGELASLEQGRDLIRRSFDRMTYEPEERSAWEDAFGRFLEIHAFGAQSADQREKTHHG
jgi:rhamnulokinase